MILTKVSISLTSCVKLTLIGIIPIAISFELCYGPIAYFHVPDPGVSVLPRIELACSLRSSRIALPVSAEGCADPLDLDPSVGWGLVLSAPHVGPPNPDRLLSIYGAFLLVSFTIYRGYTGTIFEIRTRDRFHTWDRLSVRPSVERGRDSSSISLFFKFTRLNLTPRFAQGFKRLCCELRPLPSSSSRPMAKVLTRGWDWHGTA